MENRDEIRLNYKKTLKQAEDLEKMAQRIQKYAKQAEEGAVAGIRNAWEGENASDYCRKGQRISMLIRQHGRSLQETAAVLRRTAVNTYRAEMRSIEIADRRKYK